jgi:alkane 1-monooxygenase
MVRSGYYVKSLAFTLCLSVPLMCPLGAMAGTYWLCPLLFFVVLPLAGRLMGGDPTSYHPLVVPSRPWKIYFQWLPYCYLPLWFAAFCWSASAMSHHVMNSLDVAGLALSLGIVSAVSTCVAHEIMHRRGRFDQGYARVMCALCGYGHLMFEHSAHHAQLGNIAVGGTPRAGENAYAFVWRDSQQGFRNASAIENRRLHLSRRPCWQNHIAQNYVLTGVFLTWFTGQWGLAAGALFLFQAVFSLFAVQMITFIQHYGLARDEGEAIAGHHAWADNCPIANALILNNNHHSHHHLEPRTPYYHLRIHRDAPRLPASYMVMFVIALLPPLWRVVMERRLATYGKRVARQTASPHPA